MSSHGNVREVMSFSRAKRLHAVAFAAAALAMTAAGYPLRIAHAADAKPAKIGIIGTGHIGGTLATLWAKAGYSLMLSSRHPSELKSLAKSLGPNVAVGTPRAAAAFGDVVLISVPYGALPQVGHDLAHELHGKIVLDTGNPYPQRDGPMAEDARRKGTGVASAEYLPGVRLVRAFNAISYKDLASQTHRSGELIAIPLAGDDAQALAVAQRLVRDAGFEPVVVGGLAQAKQFDVGTPVYVKLLTASQLREELGLTGAAPHKATSSH
ncbi:MAG TPA: NAD(P)-binding domain-containing protein [Steroidobacteraceae bacterium]|nr:NAD(P)-binding domain-containing protein [Steroidobacteraceae bacterium]